jgi:hypothetical protein
MKLTISKKLSSVRNLSRVGLMTVALLSSGHVAAASQCKGLDTKACGANASCGWVQSYERKDGRTVNAFCRTKSKGSKAKVSLKSIDKKANNAG